MTGRPAALIAAATPVPDQIGESKGKLCNGSTGFPRPTCSNWIMVSSGPAGRE